MSGRSEIQWVTERGVPVLLETDPALPLVDVAVILRVGALADPAGRDGTARLLARLCRSGARGQSSRAFDDAVESLGGTWSAEVGHGAMRFTGAVLAKNLAPFLELVLGSLLAPGLRHADLGEARREALADLTARQDDDRWLAARALRMHLFGSHPYARSPFGSSRSIPRIRLADLEALHAAHVGAPSILVGLAGAVDRRSAAPILERLLSRVPLHGAPVPAPPPPTLRPGRRVLFVDKPARTQAQVQIGTLGVRLRDPSFHPLVVANQAFGGSITSRLMRVVRTERGYSYAAGSRLGADVEREAFTMHAHPSLADTPACTRLMVELLEEWAQRGLGARELAQTQSYLVKSHAFERDTALKRLEPRLEAALHGLPRSFWAGFVERVRRISVPQIRAALRRAIDPSALSIVVLGTSGPSLERALLRLPGLAELSRVEYRELAQGRIRHPADE
jgi:zinc protease